jgi:membrane protease YdiL (CAAX protease family)
MTNKRKLSLSGGEIIRKALLILIICALALIEIWYRGQNDPSDIITDWYNCLSRLCGAFAALIFIIEFSFLKILHPLGNKRLSGMLYTLPALAVAINNFPWVSLAMGDCSIQADVHQIVFYAFICLCVGLFEEFAFRGCALMILLKNRRTTRLGVFMAIFWSSVIFGIVHLINIFVSSPGAVLLQIGYSALIGGLCCMVLLETGNIWLCAVIHGLYNFGGGIVSRLGNGTIWTAQEVAFTAIIGVAVAVFSVIRFLTMPLELADELFLNNKKHKKENYDNV